MDDNGDREVFPPKGEVVLNRPSVRNTLFFPTKVYPVGAEGANSNNHRVKIKCVIALIACLSLAWTVWLILLNIAPNDTVNRVMNTETLDHGSFWLMVDAPGAMMITATFGLSMVAFGYLGVVVKIINYRKNTAKTLTAPTKIDILTKVEQALDTASQRTGSGVASAVRLAASFTHEDSPTRRFIKLGMKFGDLALETLLLYQMLESGYPTQLLGIFTAVVALNAPSCAVMMFVPFERAPLAEILLDILFDFLIIVGCPMIVVFYCLSSFTFNRAKFAINLEVFPTGWFEQDAEVIANPVETAIIYESLKSLRIMSILGFLTRMGVNITLCLRLRHLVELTQNPNRQHNSMHPKRQRLAAGVLVIFAATMLLFVEESIRTSRLACQPHPECVVNAHRWIPLERDSLRQCPCLMLIDREIAPKTYKEWMNPPNVTEKVAQLATSRDLHTIQVTNRYFAELPDELRRCTNMRHIALVYPQTETVPSWVKEFTELEFLHIESRPLGSMVSLPDDLFDGMTSLTFIHFSGFLFMPHLPSFKGLTNLKSLTLSVFLILKEIPSFDKLHNLERLVLVSLPSVDTLPDFSSIKNLKSFATLDRGTWCCNGFLGDCNLNDDKCGFHPVWGAPPATCLASNQTATLATLNTVRKFSSTICGAIFHIGLPEGSPTEEMMAPCNGTLYR